jgi:glycosyltransferase involved in cell wall biosynthesis
MKTLGVDCRMVEISGIGRYLREVLVQLVRSRPELKLVLVGHGPQIERFLEREGAARASYRVVPLDAPIYSVREQSVAAWVFNRLPADVLFFPHFNVPMALRRPFVVTVHDTIHLRFPALFGRVRALIARRVMGSAVRRARRVLADSEATRRDLAALFPRALAKITVAPAGVSSRFHPASPQELAAFRLRAALPGPYLLTVGNRKPHKNLETAAAAVTRLRRQHPQLCWVVIGKRFGPDDAVDAAAADLGDALRQLQDVADDELRLYYAAATALLMPSRCEGFGLPPLEAMACGTPCVTSNTGALHEVVGDAGVTCGADDVECYVQALDRLLRDPARREQARASGLQRVHSFTWQRTADCVWQAIEAAATG